MISQNIVQSIENLQILSTRRIGVADGLYGYAWHVVSDSLVIKLAYYEIAHSSPPAVSSELATVVRKHPNILMSDLLITT